MPIVDLQRRFRELGRIRIGIKEPVMDTGTGKQKIKNGQPVSRPKKLSTFRLTSPWRHLLDAALEVGIAGEVKPWSPDEGRDEFELVTDVARLDVLVPPGETLSQWWEAWQGGGCARRCDGARMVIAGGKSADRDCLCIKEDVEPRTCKPTSRLLVMLPGLPDLGVWRLESHGFNAALELGGAVGLTELATARGVIIPAELRIEKRSVKRPGQPVKRFAVPVLGFRGRLGETLGALGFGDPSGMALQAGAGPIQARAALNEGGTPALSHGDPTAAPEADANRPIDVAALPTGKGGAATDAQPPGGGAAREDDAGDGADEDIPDAVIVPEPEAFDPPRHDPTAEEEQATGGASLTVAQLIAVKARELEVDDDTRHAVIGIVTRGRTRTGKEVTAKAELDRILRVMAAIHAGTIKAEVAADVWTFTDEKGAVMVLNVDNTIGRPDLGEHADAEGNFKKGPK